MKKNLLTVLILALLIVNIVLTSVMMFSVMGTNKKTAELVSDIMTVLDLELTVPGQEEPVEEVSLANTEVYELEGSMTIPLTTMSEGDAQYIMFEVALSMNKKNKDYKKYGENVGQQESLIKDVINSTVNAHTESECRNDFEEIRAEILKAIQDLFQSDFIYRISISEIRFG